MSLNNKGQTLVMFVLIIPIILLALVLIYDVAGVLSEKNRLSNTNYLAVEYALDNLEEIDENTIVQYILNNNDDLSKISVVIDDQAIDVETEKKIKGTLGKNFNFDLTTIKSSYRGTINDGKKNIERIK